MSGAPKIDFETIYTLYYHKLKRYAQNYVLDGNDAENIVHDIFTDLWERWDDFSSHTNLFAYLYLSTKNRCLNHLKRATVSRKVQDKLTTLYRAELELNRQVLEGDEMRVDSLEDVEQALADAVSRLPERCRQIFVMSRFEGKKHADIASELNITVNTVETQMGVAYRKLRGLLKNFHFFLALFF